MSDESDLLIKNEFIARYKGYESVGSEVRLHLDQYVQTDPEKTEKSNNFGIVCCVITTLIICSVVIAALIHNS